jgi:hypothetical protein
MTTTMQMPNSSDTHTQKTRMSRPKRECGVVSSIFPSAKSSIARTHTQMSLFNSSHPTLSGGGAMDVFIPSSVSSSSSSSSFVPPSPVFMVIQYVFPECVGWVIGERGWRIRNICLDTQTSIVWNRYGEYFEITGAALTNCHRARIILCELERHFVFQQQQLHQPPQPPTGQDGGN